MSASIPMATIVSAYAGSKARQLKRDALLIGFIAFMAFLAGMALFGALAAYVAQTHGIVIGLLAAAGLALALAVVALAIRAILRRRALRRQRIATASATSALAVSAASSLIAQNKTMAIAAGLVLGLIAGSAVRPGRN